MNMHGAAPCYLCHSVDTICSFLKPSLQSCQVCSPSETIFPSMCRRLDMAERIRISSRGPPRANPLEAAKTQAAAMDVSANLLNIVLCYCCVSSRQC